MGQAKSLQSKQPWTVRKFRSKLLQARLFLIIFIASLNLLCCAISSDLINSLQRLCHVQSLTDVWFQALQSQSSGPFPSMHRPIALQSYALLSFKKDFILMMLYYWEICCGPAWASFYAFILWLCPTYFFSSALFPSALIQMGCIPELHYLLWRISSGFLSQPGFAMPHWG